MASGTLIPDVSKLSPMMQQYVATKESLPDCLLFYRLGDFYELFFDDAILVSRELELTLTGRSCGEGEKAPMCGVPFHAADTYIDRLVGKGYKVAVCEQMEDPKAREDSRALVKREITRIVTPGTSMNTENLAGNASNFIACINRVADCIGLAYCDLTTGEFAATEFVEEEKLLAEMARIKPAELVLNEATEAMQSFDLQQLGEYYSVFVSAYPSMHFQTERAKSVILRQFKVGALDGFGLERKDLAVTAAGALLEYLEETQKRDLGHIRDLKSYSVSDYMMLDAATRRNLELCETMRDKERKGSLLWVLDYTRTAMGGRELRRYLEEPLIDKAAIEKRQEAVEGLFKDPMLRAELREYLSGIYDMERLMGRISYGTANARDMVALKVSLEPVPAIKNLLRDLQGQIFGEMAASMDPLSDLYQLIDERMEEEPPLTLHEGGLIKPGFSEQVDTYRDAANNGKSILAQLEADEKEKTGIKTLRIGYNHVFGYYIEVSKGQMSMVPDRYIRKQTLTTGERYITEELKGMEDMLLGAKEKDETLEYDLFCELRDTLAKNTARIQQTANKLAMLDALYSLAEAAERGGYVKPEILPPGEVLEIREGRHPVVEKMLGAGAFIANDTVLDNHDNQICILTGPNMSGKSTYMRQVALITLMAQIGSFVPAKAARISVTDRIFTRVGASDDLATGRSTFMMEMSEVSNILRHATKNSLLILDEIGRGTSTYDGLSIAWAVVEYIADKKLIGAKTLFATHYHELTELEGQLPGVKNYCVAVKETADGILFLHRIHAGKGNQSYGIEVAKLAGLPNWVLLRSKEILNELLTRGVGEAAADIAAKSGVAAEVETLGQMDLFGQMNAEPSVEEKLRAMDLNSMTPMEALQTLYQLKESLK